MSLMDAMFSGVSGLDAESDALSVIGNNVSNQNTVGFKESRAIFETVMGSAAGSASIGGGVAMSSTQQIFTQGSMETTGNPTDVALSGDGFFVVQGAVGGTTGNFYTRAGQSSLNSSGVLVNPDGLAFQGYMMQPGGTMSTELGPITVPSSGLQPQPTANMTISANLDANATPPAAAWDPTNPATTSNFSTSMNVYDSLGNAHEVQVYFANTAPGQWTYHEVANGSEVTGGTPGQNDEIGNGTLQFNPNGSLETVTPNPNPVTFNGANPQNININFGSQTSTGGSGLDGTTDYGSTSVVTSQSQDGYASGALSGVQIGSDGTVSGVYSNGQTLAIGQLAVAKFVNDGGLSSQGQNVWSSTLQSGVAALGAAGTGGRGSISSGTLEQSNVDISQQFVDLIAHQQGFQANSKTIQTADQMLTSLLQIVQ